MLIMDQVSGQNPNLGRQWNPPGVASGRAKVASALDGGHQGFGPKADIARRVRTAGQYVPKNDDGMTVIAHDARADGKPSAWLRNYELN